MNRAQLLTTHPDSAVDRATCLSHPFHDGAAERMGTQGSWLLIEWAIDPQLQAAHQPLRLRNNVLIIYRHLPSLRMTVRSFYFARGDSGLGGGGALEGFVLSLFGGERGSGHRDIPPNHVRLWLNGALGRWRWGGIYFWIGDWPMISRRTLAMPVLRVPSSLAAA